MKVVVLAGGISTERDVSLCSGRQVYNALKKNGHNVILLDVFLGYEGEIEGIFDRETDWVNKVAPVSEETPDIEKVKASREGNSNELFGKNVINICKMADIVFMALHGDCGENGKIQAAFDLFDIKYTGTNSLSSSLAMDKALAKMIFSANGVKTPTSFILDGVDDLRDPKFPCVVKVSGGGSSVGVYIVNNKEEYKNAIKEAYKYENKILVEEYIKGREFTDCVIEGMALPIVEIEPKTGFYDYKNKYQAGSTIETCPANISKELTERIKAAAVDAYNALSIETYARIDLKIWEKSHIIKEVEIANNYYH